MDGLYDYGEQDERLEEQEDYYDEQQEAIEEGKRMGYDYPRAKESESLYHLFHQVLKLPDSSKVGNLDKTELGLLNMSVRDCQRIALLANSLGHHLFGTFFRLQGEIILRTSASKKGWFTELFVSQKKASLRSQSFDVQQKSKQGRLPWQKNKEYEES